VSEPPASLSTKPLLTTIRSRDGDLVTGSNSESSILHRFAVPQTAHQGNAFDLNQRLDLGVGGDGVIGRRVSFVNEQTVLGEGIIGWN
jgi:predicted NAD/FAD-dependent oxidoreductase